MEISTRQYICLEILKGKEEAAFLRHGVSDDDRAALRRCAHEIAWAVTRKRAPYRHYATAPIRNPIRWGMWVSACFALFSLAYATRLFPLVQLDDPKTYPIATAATGLLAIAAASVGWAVTGVISARNTRIAHSLTIVSDRFSKSDFSKQALIFNGYFRDKRINKALMDELAQSEKDEDREAVQAVRYLLNFFEYVSVGVILGELDETIIKKTLRGNLVHYYDKCAVYIREEQRSNPRALENLTMLRAHFRDR